MEKKTKYYITYSKGEVKYLLPFKDTTVIEFLSATLTNLEFNLINSDDFIIYVVYMR